MRFPATPILLAALQLACGGTTSTGGSNGDGDGDAGDTAETSCDSVCEVGYSCNTDTLRCDLDVEAVCNTGTRWSEGTSAFREVTSDWLLDEIFVQGVRINVTDIDGDGWPDLHVRRGGIRWDNFDDETRHTWLLRNTGQGTFEDVTEPSEVLYTRSQYEANLGRPGEVVAWADVDNDGDLDVYTGLSTFDPDAYRNETSEIMLNDGTGLFSFTSNENGIRRAGVVDVPAGASFVDVDRDGNIDLFVGQHNYTPPGGASLTFMQDRLYRGDGTGDFVDVTLAAGLETQNWVDIEVMNAGGAHTRCWATTACDLNGDGFTELLSASYGRSPNHLWVGGAGSDDLGISFSNHSVDSGYAYDGDFTWSDNQFAACYCQGNRSAAGCADVAAPLIGCTTTNWNHSQDREAFRLGGNSGGTVCADIDNDGDMDLLTGEIRHWWAGGGADGSELLINQSTGEDGAPTFERLGDEALGLAVPHNEVTWDEGHMTGMVFDFDNDGWQDVYIGASDYAINRGLLYHQDRPLVFSEVGTRDFFEHNRSHGAVHADFDRDGDLDVVVGHSRARCDATLPNNCYETTQVRMFENILGDRGNWIQVALEGGAGSNRAAIGARVTVTAGGVTQTQEVGGGYGHYGAQNDLVLHFGLGEACEAEVSVRWPDQALTTQQFRAPAGHRYELTQGQLPTVSDP
jgi:hypothetical protein